MPTAETSESQSGLGWIVLAAAGLFLTIGTMVRRRTVRGPTES